MGRYLSEPFVASGTDCPLPIPLWRGWHDVDPGTVIWIDNRLRTPGMILLQYIEMGAMQVRWHGTLMTAEAPALVMLAFGENSQYGIEDRRQSGYRSVWLNADGHGLSALCHDLRARTGPLWPDPNKRIARCLRPLLTTAATHLTMPALTRLFAEVLITVHEMRQPPLPTGAAAKALAALAADPFKPWDLSQLAAAHGCSRSQLFRQARARWGVSAKRWLDRQRVQRAVHLLDHSDDSVAAIAKAVGYRSPQVLNRRLRAERGRSARRQSRRS